MHAEAVGLQPQRPAVDIGEGLAAGDGQGLGEDALGVLVHRAGQAPRHQLTVGQVGTVGEGLEQQRHPGRLGQLPLAPVVGQGQDHQRQAGPVGGAGDQHRHQQRIVAHQIVVQRAVRLDIGELGAGRAAEGAQRAELIQHQGGDILRRAAQVTPPEALQVGIGGMRADGHAMPHGQGHAALHDQRVAGVKAAGQVGLVDQRHGVLVVAHAPGAVALAHVAVEEYACSHAGSLRPA